MHALFISLLVVYGTCTFGHHRHHLPKKKKETKKKKLKNKKTKQQKERTKLVKILTKKENEKPTWKMPKGTTIVLRFEIYIFCFECFFRGLSSMRVYL